MIGCKNNILTFSGKIVFNPDTSRQGNFRKNQRNYAGILIVSLPLILYYNNISFFEPGIFITFLILFSLALPQVNPGILWLNWVINFINVRLLIFGMIYLLNPFTKTMLAQLRRVRAIELSKTERNICVADDFKGSLAGLFKRGFVNTKMVMLDGKEILSIYYPGRQIFFR